MYWLLGSLMIIVMMGVLAVADSLAIPINSSIELHNANSWPLLLLIIAIVLMAINQRQTLSTKSVNVQKFSSKHHSSQPFFSQDTSKYFSSSSKFPIRIVNYLLIMILAMGLVMGSALQALMGYQQAEATKITESMRVQALVTIEGISDSVYDGVTNSGYRQVATVSHISPLISELTAQELDSAKVNYFTSIEDSLSNNNLFDDTSNESSDSNIEYRVLLNAYPKKGSKSAQVADLNQLRPGDQLFMTLTLAPLATSEQALNNPSGFDSYRWLRGRNIDGVANIVTTSTSSFALDESSALETDSRSYLKRFRTRIDQGRWQLRQHFYREWAGQTTAMQQAKAVTLSLLTGDRSLINRDTKDLYQLAGISHLLAISGTHVLFLAIMLAGAVVFLLNRLYPALYRHIPRWQVRWWVMISAAFIYALFTGFDVPAARTAWMLLAIGLVRLTLLPISTMRVLLALAVLMAWFDPYVLWQAGYWLSFVAVALLLKYDSASQSQNNSVLSPSARYPSHRDVHRSRILLIKVWLTGKRVFKLQFWLFISLLPITLLLFGKASLWGLVINLFAIGLFGWVIVPLNLLAGLCYLLWPALADSIWVLVSAIIGNLHDLITWLTSLPALSEAWLYTPVNMAILLMVLLAMLPWLLPRGLISRWLALPPLTLLMMTVYANQQSLATSPTLYILPTGDRYISAAVLQYPIMDNEVGGKDNKAQSAKGSVSWLFLADHRPSATRTMPSTLTAEKLSAILEQQLRTLSIKRLEGLVVQTSSAGLTDTLTTNDASNTFKPNASELLPMTVARISQRLPTSQYWQAGRSDRWFEREKLYKETSESNNANNAAHVTTKTYISPKSCEQNDSWQLPNGGLSLQAMTGWSKIDDASVWDCIIAIDSRLPIQVLQYNAADPLNSPLAISQLLTAIPSTAKNTQPNNQELTMQAQSLPSRIVVDADTHQRVWQLWSLLCQAEPFDNSAYSHHTWLGHSASHLATDDIKRQRINEVITYDDNALEAALSLNAH
ncbi:ComEC/Rec2 family competence protein [Psychrobacter sp. PAMC 21119]|uniref:ComEC/Rec2 family competence protein n=1 Tax=Psychrobacter sp. PAMC 21119 TaxID=1112209 RepID=UPI000289658E|nr:ComEC/Rec2 family competence protein [Psychrobacter sp. PAMC 21119]